MSEKKSTEKEINLTLDEAMKELSKTIKMLEGEVPLEKAVELFSRANDLKEYCAMKLEKAKMKIDSIRQKNAPNIDKESD